MQSFDEMQNKCCYVAITVVLILSEVTLAVIQQCEVTQNFTQLHRIC